MAPGQPVRYTVGMRIRLWNADARTVRAWDGVMTFWVVFWLVVGVWTGYQLWQLTGLASSTVDSGRALQSAGRALVNMADLPVIGDKTGEIGANVVATATGIVEGGAQADRSIRGLSVLIGLTVALAPVGPVILFYLPSRLAFGREVAHIGQALREDPGSTALRAHLAGRAVASLGYARLRELSENPWGDLASGRHDALARAEVARLGLPPPPEVR